MKLRDILKERYGKESTKARKLRVTIRVDEEELAVLALCTLETHMSASDLTRMLWRNKLSECNGARVRRGLSALTNDPEPSAPKKAGRPKGRVEIDEITD